MAKSYTNKQKLEGLYLKDQGFRTSIIAEKIGCSKGTINAWSKQYPNRDTLKAIVDLEEKAMEEKSIPIAETSEEVSKLRSEFRTLELALSDLSRKVESIRSTLKSC